jgi:hypothetical protein
MFVMARFLELFWATTATTKGPSLAVFLPSNVVALQDRPARR